MRKLLHLDASVRSTSFSRELGSVFVEHWKAANPDGAYTYRDLVAEPVKPIDEARATLMTLSGMNGIKDLASMDALVAEHGLEEAWAETRPLIVQLIEADVLVIGTPMYNFTVPGSLKTWMDRVTLPWLPLAGKSAVILSARGGAYGPGMPREGFDFQEPLLRGYFTVLGVEDVEFVHTELTHATVMPFLAQFKDTYEAGRAAALEQVKELAARVPAEAPAA
ncbi:NAD(P)H-dependent oxidoreductase [Kitasatospora sp. NPDC097605]|uniref:FMN-dependent NADH-azoreductase n=1 Tax=Kitasatospora sp. NPDC097605 TaxID=3157226 RepID=UPI0033318402